jgi:hypothetical protein
MAQVLPLKASSMSTNLIEMADGSMNTEITMTKMAVLDRLPNSTVKASNTHKMKMTTKMNTSANSVRLEQ